MNQELMTLDFWQDTVIYEGKTVPVGTLACDALNVPARSPMSSILGSCLHPVLFFHFLNCNMLM